MNQEREKRIKSFIKDYSHYATEVNDYLADNPELSGKEFKSVTKIISVLKEDGFDVIAPFDNFETSFFASYGHNDHKYKVAILVEYDALPVIGHGCGHCVSGSISILTGMTLKHFQDELNTDIHLIGTPIEEEDGAKVKMVQDGIFDDYDMTMMIHLYNKNIITPTFLALDSFLYTFEGKAAHAATAPWKGKNALNAVQLMIHAIDMMRQHVKPDVKIHCVIKNGGEAPNIVPEEASVEYYARSNSREYLNEVVERMDNCAKGATLCTDTTVNKKPTAQSYDDLLFNQTGDKILNDIYKELGLEIFEGNDTFGSSDAGNVSYVCPTFHPTLKLVDESVNIHTREFASAVKTERAYKCIEIGATILSYLVNRIFSDEDLVKKMKEDFNNIKSQ